ncbi:Chalcone isomerase - like 5, partial [Theobroma cacao]
MSSPPSATQVDVDNIVFPPSAKPPASSTVLFLGFGFYLIMSFLLLGHSKMWISRGLYIDANFKKFTAIGVYLGPNAVPLLAAKWRGKSAQELMDSVEFFRDIVAGIYTFHIPIPFEKFTQVTFISPLTSVQHVDKVGGELFGLLDLHRWELGLNKIYISETLFTFIFVSCLLVHYEFYITYHNTIMHPKILNA